MAAPLKDCHSSKPAKSAASVENAAMAALMVFCLFTAGDLI
jgi:hypothetical protein